MSTTNTIIKKVVGINKDDIGVIDLAAYVLKNGGLVAFPTETVYGLGANALDEAAVSAVYTAKGRPSDNPLIIHIFCMEQLEKIAKRLTPLAKLLAEKFWPGPLTIVVEKNDIIPYKTSGGLETVAVRLPSNSTARLLLERSGIMIAAPSANLSGRPSPTSAEHVLHDLNGKVDMIIDGGECVFGLESTVVDATGVYPVILRPGSVTVNMLKSVCGEAYVDPAVLHCSEDIKPKSPGQKYRHYSPKAELALFNGGTDSAVCELNKLIQDGERHKIGVMCADDTAALYDTLDVTVISLGNRNNPEEIGANLYKTLRIFDSLGVDRIYAETYPESGPWLAVMNRLKKAESKKHYTKIGTKD